MLFASRGNGRVDPGQVPRFLAWPSTPPITSTPDSFPIPPLRSRTAQNAFTIHPSPNRGLHAREHADGHSEKILKGTTRPCVTMSGPCRVAMAPTSGVPFPCHYPSPRLFIFQPCFGLQKSNFSSSCGQNTNSHSSGSVSQQT